MSRRILTTDERNAIYDQTGGGEAYTLAVDTAETAHCHQHDCVNCQQAFDCESKLCTPSCHVLCCQSCDTYDAILRRAPAAYFAKHRHF